MEDKFNHIDENNNPTMVDVSEKGVSQRIAVAALRLNVTPYF